MNPSSNKKWIPAFAGMTIKHTGIRTIFLLIIALSPIPLRAAELPHHDLSVTLTPGKHHIRAVDTITLPENFPGEFTFALHAGLKPVSSDPAVRISKKSSEQAGVPVELFEVSLPDAAKSFTIEYAGNIHHPLTTGRSQARGFDQTPGSIADEGVYLASSSAWYPLLETDFLTFSLILDLPEKWDAVSQGARTAHEKTKTGTRVRWDSPEPQNEIYLIASRFAVYEKTEDKVSAQVYLRKPEAELAAKYLDATIRYIALYDSLIGPYSYRKFALVENFWETGFGMPSFTLLGPTVIRLPFIINTSYPHEILHNWWGNSVYPDYEKGNWSEGLTAYLADHLLKEQQGAGADYRLNTLQKYADYVRDARDFPLTQFTSRHSPSTEAVGYGKSLMFFHMLRRELGDKAFIAGIRHFYQHHKFRFATFSDLQKSLEAVSAKNLGAEFEQWVAKTGAPELKIRDGKTKDEGRGTSKSYVVTGRLKQVQQGKPYQLRVPVAVTMEGANKAFQAVAELNQAEQEFSIAVPARPVRVDVDPEFDLFRRLDRGEIPPAITQALGADKMLVLVPAKADKEMREAYQAFAEALAQSGPDEVESKLDSDVKLLPKDRAIALLGWDNRFLEEVLPGLKGYGVTLTDRAVRIGQSTIAKKNNAAVLAAPNPGNREMSVMVIAADNAKQLPGLARKLPHYHKYSYLVFEGAEPANIAKGKWQVLDSPLTAFLPDADGKTSRVEMGTLAPRPALAALPPVFSEERMMETVRFLAGAELGGRPVGSREIDMAADYVAQNFKKAGLEPGGDEKSYFEVWKDSATGRSMKNVIGLIQGKKPEFSGQSVALGAHYDHLGTGLSRGQTGDKGNIHPGADDNASGVAVLLELATVLKEEFKPDRSIVFIAFTGEEEGRLGSSYYVKNQARFPVSKAIGMVNLDTIGRLDKKKLLVLGAGSAAEWPHILRGAGFVTGVAIETVSEDLDSSDQKSFHEAGVPAVQLFSGPHPDYHRPTDTAEKIDGAGLVKVASVAKEAVEYLANREGALTTTLKPGEPGPGPKTERKVSLGTIPDFGYKGNGVRLAGVIQGSPAAASGLQEGDIIIRLNSSPVSGLKEFSGALKTLKPGDRVAIVVVRNGMEHTVESAVQAK